MREDFAFLVGIPAGAAEGSASRLVVLELGLARSWAAEWAALRAARTVGELRRLAPHLTVLDLPGYDDAAADSEPVLVETAISATWPGDPADLTDGQLPPRLRGRTEAEVVEGLRALGFRVVRDAELLAALVVGVPRADHLPPR